MQDVEDSWVRRYEFVLLQPGGEVRGVMMGANEIQR